MTTNVEMARKIAEVNYPLCRESVHALAAVLVCKKFKYVKDLTEHLAEESDDIEHLCCKFLKVSLVEKPLKIVHCVLNRPACVI